MTQQDIGWFCLIVGSLYAGALVAIPSLFNNWLLCPRWGLFGPPASRLSGIGAGLIVVALGFVHLNTAASITPVWLPWTAVGIAFLVMLAGGVRSPLYRAAA